MRGFSSLLKSPYLLSGRAICLVRLAKYAEAAQIYDRLLPRLKDRAKRWRVATADQAIECHRRWADQDMRNKDQSAAKSHLSQALAILMEAVRSADIDAETL